MKLSHKDEEHLSLFISDNLRNHLYIYLLQNLPITQFFSLLSYVLSKRRSSNEADKLANDLINILIKDRPTRELETECYNRIRDNIRSSGKLKINLKK